MIANEPLPRDQAITVGMVSKDSRSRFGEAFTEVLASIKSEIPYSSFILANDSRDDTPDYAASFCHAVVIPGGGNRATARQRVIDRTTTGWLLFVDDDCVLFPGWYSKMSRYMSQPEVGMVWGAQLARLRDAGSTIDTAEGSVKSFQRLGGTHDALIRMNAVKGIQIPEFLHWREDTYIKKFVEGKGFKVIATSEAGFHHIKSRSNVLRSNFAEDPRLRYLCERYLEVYSADYVKALRTLAGTLPDLLGLRSVSRKAIIKGRVAWFRYYADLYSYSPQELVGRNRTAAQV